IAAPRVVVLRVAPIRRLDRVGPESNRRRVVVEHVLSNRVVLTVLDRDPGAVAAKVILPDVGVVAVATPHTVLTAPRLVRDDRVTRERGLDPVGGRVADVVAQKQIVVGAPR